MTRPPVVAVVAGGLGTRVRHLPGADVKVLAPVHGRPFLALLLHRLRDLGAEHVHLCLGHGAGAVVAAVDAARPPLRVTWTIEDEPLGVFGALRLAAGRLGDVFAVCYGDVLPATPPAALAACLRDGAEGVVTAWENRGADEPSNLLLRAGRVARYARGEPAATHLDVGLSAFSRSVLEAVPAGRPAHEAGVLGRLAARGALAAYEVGGPNAQIGDPGHYAEALAVPPNGFDPPLGLPELLVLDRDGVLLRHVDPYVLRDEDVRPVAGAVAAVGAFAAAGCRIAVVTNQSPVARGLVPASFVERTNAWLTEQLARRGAPGVRVYVCPHDDSAGCSCRKPAPGLLLRAMADAGAAPAGTWMVGDHDVDLDAAARAGCVVRVHARSGRMLAPSRFATHVVPDVAGLAALCGLRLLD